MQEAQLWFDWRMYCGAGFNGSYPETLVVPTIAYHVDLLATQYSHKVVPATVDVSFGEAREVGRFKAVLSWECSIASDSFSCFSNSVHSDPCRSGSADTWATYLAYVRVFTHLYLARFKYSRPRLGEKDGTGKHISPDSNWL